MIRRLADRARFPVREGIGDKAAFPESLPPAFRSRATYEPLAAGRTGAKRGSYA